MNTFRALIRIQLFIIMLFALNKLWVRPWVLDLNAPSWARVLVLSFPNFCEAIVGVVFLTFVGLTLRERYLQGMRSMTVYGWATACAAAYVLTQEYRWHNLGGNNVFDPCDVIFSLVGLVTALGLLLWLRPEIRTAAPD